MIKHLLCNENTVKKVTSVDVNFWTNLASKIIKRQTVVKSLKTHFKVSTSIPNFSQESTEKVERKNVFDKNSLLQKI